MIPTLITAIVALTFVGWVHLRARQELKIFTQVESAILAIFYLTAIIVIITVWALTK